MSLFSNLWRGRRPVLRREPNPRDRNYDEERGYGPAFGPEDHRGGYRAGYGRQGVGGYPDPGVDQPPYGYAGEDPAALYRDDFDPNDTEPARRPRTVQRDEVDSTRARDLRRATDRERGHRGRGPRGYHRSDERIREDICDRLTEDPLVDATDVEVTVTNCEAVLDGTVTDRLSRRRAEDIADCVSGVVVVVNNLRIEQRVRDGRMIDRIDPEPPDGTR
jgi:hypothetical protein